MARLRTLKPSFFTHDVLAELSPLHRLLFQGLWCHADREGRLEDRPRFLKTVILPYDDGDVDAMLDGLVEHGFIVRYQAESQRLIAILNFTKHQKPHPRELPSEYPPPKAQPKRGRTQPKQDPGTTQAVPEQDPSIAQQGGLLSLDNGLGVSCLGEAKADETPPMSADADAPMPVTLGRPKALQDVWNHYADQSLPRWKDTSRSRATAADARIRENPTFAYWTDVIARINASRFCLGENDRGWRASPDWLLKPDSATKVLEGKYDNPRQTVTPITRQKRVGAEECFHSEADVGRDLTHEF